MTVLSTAALGAFLVLGGAGLASAEEVTVRVSPALLLELTAPRAADRDLAYRESLPREAPALPRPLVGEVQDDGSVRYGKATVIVRNPCPPGSIHDEPVVLPGRRSK